MEKDLSKSLEFEFLELIKICLPLESICRCLSIDLKDFKNWEKIAHEDPDSKYGQFFTKVRLVENHTRDKLINEIKMAKSGEKWLKNNSFLK